MMHRSTPESQQHFGTRTSLKVALNRAVRRPQGLLINRFGNLNEPSINAIDMKEMAQGTDSLNMIEVTTSQVPKYFQTNKNTATF